MRRDAKVISERLGHATVAFTLDVYAHTVPAMEEEAAQKVADLILDDVWTPDRRGPPSIQPSTEPDRTRATNQHRNTFTETTCWLGW